MFISFIDKAVNDILKIVPNNVIVQQLIASDSKHTLTQYVKDGYAIDFGDKFSPTVLNGVEIKESDINLAHSKNNTVNVWTVDTIKRAQELEKLGVDQITTNFDLRNNDEYKKEDWNL
jgi:glycerophosphoryl diester phosphodiesterase